MRQYIWIAATLVIGGSHSAQARFLQTDPIGYKDQVNLYTYVNNDPFDNRDPTGLKCVGEEGKKTCTFDNVILKEGQKLSKAQEGAKKAFEQSYTKVVNRLATSDRSTTVAVKGHESFKVSAKEVSSSLATRTLTYSPNASSRDAAAVTGGSIAQPSTTVYESGLHQGNLTNTLIGHEGIHGTLSEGFVLTPRELSTNPGRQDHQEPYNNAADVLLREP